MPRTRTTKKLAQRIDLNYFKRPSPLRRWRTWLTIGLPALAVVWLVWHSVRRDDTVYSSGRLSAAHAVLNSDCAACHVREAGRFSAVATDAACLTCHDGPIHHDNQAFKPTCASCHADHRGSLRLAETSDQTCVQCHAMLHTKTGPPRLENASAFPANHPEFAALRSKKADSSQIKLNHEMHMKPNLKGPNGPVQMACTDCHRPQGVSGVWPYGGLQGEAEKVTESERAGANPLPARGRWSSMAPIRFANQCAGCHSLEFDKRFSEGVPHGKDWQEIDRFIVQHFQNYIAAHPGELRVVREPDRNLTGKPIPPTVRLLSPAQWVMERTVEVESLLWRKTCKQCHVLSDRPEENRETSMTFSTSERLGAVTVYLKSPPDVVPPNIPKRWMPHAKFSHGAHQMTTCTSCHAATTSKETSDVLMPGIAVCQSCHNPSANGAESSCFLCHTYHDWSKEKPVRGKFRLREITDAASQAAKSKVTIE